MLSNLMELMNHNNFNKEKQDAFVWKFGKNGEFYVNSFQVAANELQQNAMLIKNQTRALWRGLVLPGVELLA